MALFDDLDDALLEYLLRFLNSTELRSSACLVCKRWLAICRNTSSGQQPAGGVWRHLDIDVYWELSHPRGLGGPAPPALLWHQALHRTHRPHDGSDGRGAAAAAAAASTSGWSLGNYEGRRGVIISNNSGGSSLPRPRGSSSSSRPGRGRAFLSRAALSSWLRGKWGAVEVLSLAHTEARVTVVGMERQPAPHDLQPSDLLALLSSLPSLTELHLTSASNLLPDLAALTSITTTTTTAAAPAATAAASTAAAGAPTAATAPAAPTANEASTSAATAAAAAATVSAILSSLPPLTSSSLPSTHLTPPPTTPINPTTTGESLPPPPPPPPPPPSLAPPLTTRLRRLCLRQCGYDLRSEEGATAGAALGAAAGAGAGAAGVGALGRLVGLQALELSLHPASEWGLGRLPEGWAELS
ncbi:hypothetical protein Agub_g1812, partial [Astrephomene gubernaculifera]